VFATEFGTPVEPRNLVRTIETAARKAGVKEVWVHIKAVADMLGHSSIAVTGDIYGHTSDDAARAAVDGMIGTLGLMQLVK